MRSPCASRSLTIGDGGGGIVGGVHDVIEPDDALLALAGERDGDLAVVNRGGGENGGDRHHAGRGRRMGLEGVPGGGEGPTRSLAAGGTTGPPVRAAFAKALAAPAIH